MKLPALENLHASQHQPEFVSPQPRPERGGPAAMGSGFRLEVVCRIGAREEALTRS